MPGWKKFLISSIPNKIDIPHFRIKLLEGKTEEQKKELASEVIKAAQRVIGYGDESYSETTENLSWDKWKNEVYLKEIKEPGYKMRG